MNIGIIGGGFDPIHFGHLQSAEIVKEKLKLSRVLFIPSGIPSHKQKPIASPDDRFKMLKLSLKNNRQFIPLDIEIKKEGYSWTIDTVKEIKSIYGQRNDYYFIIGTDTIPELCKWKDIDTLFDMVKFVAITRERFYTKKQLLFGVHNLQSIVNSQLKRIKIIKFPTLPVSSTFIRERLKKGLSIKYLVPENIEKYIQENDVYKF